MQRAWGAALEYATMRFQLSQISIHQNKKSTIAHRTQNTSTQICDVVPKQIQWAFPRPVNLK
jgi:hypothetical protein